MSSDRAISIRNMIRESVRDLSQIENVTIINKTDGATLVWNASQNRYEVKPAPGSSGGDIDGGTF